MPNVDRIPVLVYDDGTPTGAITMDRALRVASHIVLAAAHNSPNRTLNVTAAEHAGIPLTVETLREHTGIRHALALCSANEIFVAYVPHPGAHPGELLRNVIQAAASDQQRGLPVLAVHIVHPDAPNNGPVVEIDPAHTDAGFTALFSAGLAASLHTPLHILRLAGDRTDADLRAADALDQARRLISDNELPVYDDSTTGDPLTIALDNTHGAAAVVMGLGGFSVSGHKLTHPNQLPNRVLDTPDGQLAHHLARHATTDLVIVCDAIELHHGRAAQAAALAAAIGAITAGTIAGGAVGLAAATTAVAVATAAHHTTRSD